MRPACTWIKSRNIDPYRPWYMFIMSTENRIIQHDMEQGKPSAESLYNFAYIDRVNKNALSFCYFTLL